GTAIPDGVVRWLRTTIATATVTRAATQISRRRPTRARRGLPDFASRAENPEVRGRAVSNRWAGRPRDRMRLPVPQPQPAVTVQELPETSLSCSFSYEGELCCFHDVSIIRACEKMRSHIVDRV